MKRLSIVLAMYCFVPFLHADTIFSTFGPSNSFDTSVVKWLIGSTTFDEEEEVAGSFVPSVSATLQTIDFAATHISGGTGVIVALAADSSGTPGAAIESFTVAVGSSTPSIYTANSVLNPVLSAGVTYWVTMAAQSPRSTDIIWNLNDQHTFPDPSTRNGAASAWSPAGANLESQYPAFDVLGNEVSVPEPSALSLLAASLALCLGIVVQKRTASLRG